MSARPKPSEENDFLCQHVVILRASLRHFAKRELVDPRMSDKDAARFLFQAPFAVVSHDAAKDPVFNYANQTALSLFAMTWEQFTSLPSRLSAETVKQEGREEILRLVKDYGFMEGYSGIRIGRHGRRFLIEEALVWNLLGGPGRLYKGQAALFKDWKLL